MVGNEPGQRWIKKNKSELSDSPADDSSSARVSLDIRRSDTHKCWSSNGRRSPAWSRMCRLLIGGSGVGWPKRSKDHQFCVFAGWWWRRRRLFVCLGQEAPCRTRTASMKEEPYQRKDWTKDSAIAERRKRNESSCQMKTSR
ncbi:uncharacterized protein LOC144006901 isoform X2 [Festucalex cinctus]